MNEGMGAIGVVYVGTSIDGFIARADGGIDWLGKIEPAPESPDLGWSTFISGIDAIVMGGNTFDQLLTFDQWIYGQTPLVVWSRTRTEVPEHLRETVRVSALPPDALMAELSSRGAKRVYVDGGVTVQAFLRAGLVGELTVTQLPVLIGEGLPLFGSLPADIWWRHDKTETFSNGLVKTRWVTRESERTSTGS